MKKMGIDNLLLDNDNISILAPPLKIVGTLLLLLLPMSSKEHETREKQHNMNITNNIPNRERRMSGRCTVNLLVYICVMLSILLHHDQIVFVEMYVHGYTTSTTYKSAFVSPPQYDQKNRFFSSSSNNIHRNYYPHHYKTPMYYYATTSSLSTTSSSSSSSSEMQMKPMSLKDMIQTLHSYESNIRRTRSYITDTAYKGDHGNNIQIKKHQQEKSETVTDTDTHHHNTGIHIHHHQQQQHHQPTSTSCMIAIRSFVRKLQHEVRIWKEYNTNNCTSIIEQKQPYTSKFFYELDHQHHDDDGEEQQLKELQFNLNNVIVQAIRSSADYGDYNMISTIIETAIEYNTQLALAQLSTSRASEPTSSQQQEQHLALLQPRIFGEAITELQRTKANISKIKKIWKLLLTIANNRNNIQHIQLLTTQPSAYELNLILLAMSRRGRVRAALSLYYWHIFGQRINKVQQHSGHDSNGLIIIDEDDFNYEDDGENTPPIRVIKGDAYTASTIMSILAESILNEIRASVQSSSEMKSSRQTSLSKQSPCWQWREAEKILNTMEKNERYKDMLNNHVYASVLKVNDAASALYNSPGSMHYGSKIAMSVLERMRRQQISPDVVTCSAVMSTFDKGKQWKAALALLKSMEMTKRRTNDRNNHDSGEEKWVLPKPNEYSYASAVSSCARSGQFDEAIKILDRLRRYGLESKDVSTKKICNTDVTPNIWIYNAALASCLPTHSYQFKKKKMKNNLRSSTAIKILRRMEKDAQNGLDTAPDTVTYNTVIATIGCLRSRYLNGHDSSLSHDLLFCDDAPMISEVEINTMKLLQEMKDKNIERDPITYRNALLACRKDQNAIMRLLDIAIEDIATFKTPVISDWGSIREIKLYFVNVALSACETNGGIDFAKELFEYMSHQNILADTSTMSHLLRALSSSGNSDDSMLILNAMKGDGAANAIFMDEYGIDIIASGNFDNKPMIHEYHYSSAITYCLRREELFSALKILNGMKVHGLKPNEESLKGIILAYCKLAIDASADEFRKARAVQMKKGRTQRKNRILPVEHTTSRVRATAAIAMLNSMKEPPTNLQSCVASACAASGMWVDARKLLWSIHSTAVQKIKGKHPFDSMVQENTDAISELPKLHRSLLKLCARSGNITAALWYSRAIQDFTNKLERQKYNKNSQTSNIFNSQEEKESEKESASYGKDTNLISTDFMFSSSKTYSNLMGVEEWKLVNIAASKSCHWKVCLRVLQLVQPFVERTHPKHALGQQNNEVSLEILNREYDGMARILTDSVLAFELRSQYAWAVRAIYDWMEWSGRRPKREAVYAACRVLSSRGLGNQVSLLIASVLQISDDESAFNNDNGDIPSYEDSYERGIYTEAITALFQNGLYDNADELYAKAVSERFLPWAVVEESKSEHMIKGLQLDLHGMNKAMAHSAVRVSLQHLIQSNSNSSLDIDITIITGRGKRSSQHLRPVLRPEVQRMLMEEFYPPLGTSSIPGNLGVLKVSVSEVEAWVQHQEQQKGVRFLAVADALKTLTSGQRLKQLLQKSVDENNAN